jgi:hypothetical protein
VAAFKAEERHIPKGSTAEEEVRKILDRKYLRVDGSIAGN